MNYIVRRKRPALLGVTVSLPADATGRQIVRASLTEGLSDSAKYLTIGLIAIGIYAVVPRSWTRRLKREAKAFL